MKRMRIAAMMAGLDREYQREFARGMVDEAASRNVDLCIFNCQGQAEVDVIRNDKGENAIFDLPDLSSFDGVVALCYTMVSATGLDHINELISRLDDKPLVTIDTTLDIGVEVTFDDTPSVRALMEHLTDHHGYRRFAIVTGPMDNKVAVDRYHTSCQVLQEKNCKVEAIYDGSWTRAGGSKAAESMLADPRGLPEVVVCGNDDMAFGVIERFAEDGIKVPEDVKVTGFDARHEAVNRGLTTILRPSMEAGRESVKIIMDWIGGRKPKDKLLVMPTRVIYGTSCGCAQSSTQHHDYVRRLNEDLRQIERGLTRASGFSSALAGVSGQEEAGRVITNFALSWGVKDMHVCVSPDFLMPEARLQERGYPDRMLLLSSCHEGAVGRQMTFDTGELIPILQQKREKPMALAFSPLYYLDRQFGYAVVDLEHATGVELYSVLTLLGGALMSLHLKCTVQVYAEALENMSVHDPLTGLYNRRGYNQLAPVCFEKAQRERECFAVISCDMDGMKRINDEFGHMAGDTAITRMGRAMRVLEMDGMTCVHISGDEFIAVGLVKNSDDVLHLAENLRQAIEDINHRDRWITDIAASIGTFAAVPRADDSLDDFLIRADGAMYRSKRSKRQD